MAARHCRDADTTPLRARAVGLLELFGDGEQT
jgi:hypothetical protein